MHPAPSLAESFPKDSKTEERGQKQQQRHVPHQHDHLELVHPDSMQLENNPLSSPPIRKDTASSTSTNASTDATVVTSASTDSNASVFSVESSQSIFSVKDGAEVSNNRRASRRRTGPLSAQQREKAALIRKLGACGDCRRRRVACHPNHHNMTWEDAVRKYRSSSPLQDLAPLAGRPISPAPIHYTQDPQDMKIDMAPSTPNARTPPGRAPLSDARIRTPLPSGPRLDKQLPLPPLVGPLPSFTASPSQESVKTELERAATRILSSPHRNRYTSVTALLICWQDDEDPSVVAALDDLSDVFDKYYCYAYDVIKIPPSASDGCTSSWRWLSRIINEFTDKNDTRDALKIVYYNGFSYLDDHREMVLASSLDRGKASTIRWSGIQQILEEACSDTLIIMDSAYYPSSKMVRQKGVLELIAASASKEYFNILDRSSFTRALVDQLRSRAAQRLLLNPLSAAELHSKLLSIYPKIIYDREPGKGAVSGLSSLSPLHMQISGNSRLPSITLSPPQLPRTLPSPEIEHAPQLTLSMRLAEESLSLESWAEWLRMMPEGIKDVKVEGPYHTFR